jgi:PadR family transcriptional regulator PadR
MNLLRRTEELILLTILQLGETAYGVPIRRRLIETTGESFSFASVYVPLDRLAERGYGGVSTG